MTREKKRNELNFICSVSQNVGQYTIATLLQLHLHLKQYRRKSIDLYDVTTRVRLVVAAEVNRTHQEESTEEAKIEKLRAEKSSHTRVRRKILRKSQKDNNNERESGED